MREAFTYMLKDNCYYKKALVFMILTFIETACLAYAQMNSCTGACPYSMNSGVFVPNKTNALLFQVIGLIFNLIVVGYFNTCLEAVTKQVNNIVLPFINLWNNFLNGLKYFVAVFIAALVYILSLGLLYALNLYVAKTVSILVLLFYIIFSSAFLWLFANNKSFFAFLNYKKLFLKIKEAPKNYFKYLGFLAMLLIISATLKFIIDFIITLLPLNLLFTMLISTFFTSLLSAYFSFVFIYLIAKSLKQDSVV